MAKQEVESVTVTKKKVKKLPHKQTVTILGRKVPVTFRKPSKDSYGEFSSTPLEIFINEGMSQVDTRRTLIHEMTHAGFALAGISNYQITNKAEESICTLMESLLEDIVESLIRIKTEED